MKIDRKMMSNTKQHSLVGPLRAMVMALFVVSILVFVGESASATTIIFDQSPGAVGGTRTPARGVWLNYAGGQNFGTDILISGAGATLTGMDVYTSPDFTSTAGDSVTVRIWADAAGTPAALLNDFIETISIIDTDGIGSWGPTDTQRVHADFTSTITLLPGTYWIGMSSTAFSPHLGQYGISGGTGPLMGNTMARFQGTTYVGQTSADGGDGAIRVWGETQTPIPEPATIGLLGIGLAGLAGAEVRRRRKKKAVDKS